MSMFFQDLRYAVRALRKAPGFTLAAVVALALGIGANATVFTVIDSSLLRPFTFPGADRMIIALERQKDRTISLSYPNFVDWRDQTRDVFSAAGATRRESFSLTGVGEPKRVKVRMMSAELFPLASARAQLGRLFSAEEDRPGAERTAVLTDAFWRAQMGGDPNVIGRSVQMSGDAYTIIGVLPPDFRFLRPVDLIVPLGLFGDRFHSRGAHPGLAMVARMKDGVTLERARAALDAVGERLEKAYPDTNQGARSDVATLRQNQVGDVESSLLVLWAAVAAVLLIAAANVANLLLARAASRQQEIAVRIALGAGRGQLIRLLLTESVVLSLIGGAAGVLLATWGIDALGPILPPLLPRAAADMQVNGAVLAFTLGLSVLSGIGFGLAPALQLSAPRLHAFLADARSTPDRRRHRLRSALVVAEVSLSLVLLVTAGLLLRSFAALRDVDPGFEPDHVLTVKVSLPPDRYPGSAQIIAFERAAREKLRALPGVVATAASLGVPLQDASESSVEIMGRPRVGPSETPMAVSYAVTPGYLESLRIPLQRGRFITEEDSKFPGVAVIDEAMAKELFPGQDPLGQRLYWDGGKPGPAIVGIVKHVAQYSLSGEKALTNIAVYLPYEVVAEDGPNWARELSLLVRTSGEPRAAERLVRGALGELDGLLPVYDVSTMEETVAASLANQEFTLVLLGAFAALALVLAAVGIYGVMAYSVANRTREIGIRLALGAPAPSVLGLVVRDGSKLTGIGLAIGLMAAIAASRALGSLLYGVPALDPVTYAAVAIGLGGVALLASYVPARRAVRVDPAVTLRTE